MTGAAVAVAPDADAAEVAPAQSALSLRTKLAYGFGAMANGAYTPLAGFVLFFYNQIVGVPAAMVSLAMSAAVLVDACWDPVIGQYSDRFRSRWGRRHPFMYVAIPLMVLAIYLRWHPNPEWSDAVLAVYVLATGLFVNLAISIYEVPSNALAPELARSYHERTALQSYRWTFGAVATGIVTMLAYGVFLRPTPEQPVGQLNAAGYGQMAWTVSIICIVAILVCAIGTHRHIPELHRPEGLTQGLRAQLREMAKTFRNYNFRVAFVANLIAGLGTGLTNGLTLYIFTYFWGLNQDGLLVLALIPIIAVPISAVLAPYLSRRYGKREMCMALFFASVLFGNLPIVLRLLGLFPLDGTPLLLPLIFVSVFLQWVLGLAGFIIVSSMTSDIVEDSQAETGRRSEGLLFTAESFPNRLMTSFATLLPGLLLAFVGFPEKAQPGQVPEAVVNNLMLIYLPVIVVIHCASIATWAFFRISESKHEANLRAVGL